jgi:IclR family acetate operon transcriptional repressor
MISAPKTAGTFDRAIDLLQAVLNDGGASGIGAIAADLNVPPSSAHRIVALLERRGLLVRAGRGRYRAGLALVATLPPGALDVALTATGRPVLRELAIETGYTAHLGVLRSDMVTYLVKEGAAAGHLFTREAMQLEAYCSGIGKILLAGLPEEALRNYLEQGEFVALTDQTIIDPLRLDDHLRIVRQQGYALDDREIAADLNCLAVPVRRADGRVVAGISIVVNTLVAIEIPALLIRLREAADALERHMSS